MTDLVDTFVQFSYRFSYMRNEDNVGAGPSGLSIYASVSIAVNLVRNGHSTNGSSDSQTPKMSKKRPKRPETSKNNQDITSNAVD